MHSPNHRAFLDGLTANPLPIRDRLAGKTSKRRSGHTPENKRLVRCIRLQHYDRLGQKAILAS
jgi:hypothetical protein